MTPRKLKLYKTLKGSRRKLQYYKKKSNNLARYNINKKITSKYTKSFLREKIVKRLPISAAAKMLLASQIKNADKKKTGRTWTMDEKALFVTMYKSSPKTYRLLSSLLTLPSRRTLLRYLQKINIKVGLNNNLLNYLNNCASLMKKKEKYCVLMFDEMSIRPNLHFNYKQKQLNGLENVGEGAMQKVADHVLVFMLHGINQRWKQPIAFYFSHSTIKTDTPAQEHYRKHHKKCSSTNTF